MISKTLKDHILRALPNQTVLFPFSAAQHNFAF